MLTLEDAKEVVEWAEENGIPYWQLIFPHIVFIGSFVILGIMVVLTI